jgi:hypothetical protein
MVVHLLQQRQCKDNLIMTTRDFTANVISATKVVPDGNFKDSKASGIWDINEALDLIKGGNWPNVANLNPAAFVDALFQTHLYTGNGGTQTITNNVDLTKGGLTWIKGRMAGGFSHYLFDTERGVTKYLRSNETNEEQTDSNTLTAFNNNGFTVGSANATNYNTGDFVSWTFRKQPKFFDIVTYTGNATNRTISHSLGSVPGMILVKDLSGTGAWAVYHRSVGNGAGQNYVLNLSTTAGDASGVWNGTAPTSSVFSVGTDGTVNESGRNFVAYLFAHNDNDGGFGAAEDQDIIKCGHFDTNSSEEATIDLGFEPQWVFYKRYNGSSEGDWLIYDAMRGMQGDFLSQAALLEANTSDAEDATTNRIAVTSTGFKVDNWGTASVPFIYVAIRRGGMQTPTAASSVFEVFNTTNNTSASDIGSMGPSDLLLSKRTDGSQTWRLLDRLRGGTMLRTDSNDEETDDAHFLEWDRMTGVGVTSQGAPYLTNDAQTHWSWKRARGYFDVVAYTGNNNYYTSQNVAHNLGVVPEMIWIKNRDRVASWAVYNKTIGAQKKLDLDGTSGASANDSAYFNNTTPTSSVFTVGNSNRVNQANEKHIAYLFATVDGVSKVGSFSHTNGGGDTNVDCGFSGNARLVIYKRTDSTGSWYLFDSVRGIVSGSGDAQLELNSNGAENTGFDLIDPYSSGFKIPSNATGTGDYIFYAIA